MSILVFALPLQTLAIGVGSGGSTPCNADVWECGPYGTCALSGQQVRTCAMTFDCPNVASPPKPAETQSCTPECTADTWTCGGWGPCLNRTQERFCTKSYDCPLIDSPSPQTDLRCSVDCGLDQWTCGAWSSCVVGTRTRACVLRENCEDRGMAKPAEQEACAPTAPVAPARVVAPVRIAPAPTRTTSVEDPLPTKAEALQLVCGGLATLRERVTCRLGLSPEVLERELGIEYLPEECRALRATASGFGIDVVGACVARYRALRPCWDAAIGAPRLACVRGVLGLRDLVEERRVCERVGTDRAQCIAAFRARAYPFITFRFYDLEERAEGLRDLGAPLDLVATFVTAAAQGKIDFNNATTTEQRIAIIRAVQQSWRTFVAALPAQVRDRAAAEGLGPSPE